VLSQSLVKSDLARRIDRIRMARRPGQPPWLRQATVAPLHPDLGHESAEVACIAPVLELLRHERHPTCAPRGVHSFSLRVLLLGLEAGAPLRMRLALLLLGIDHDKELPDKGVEPFLDRSLPIAPRRPHASALANPQDEFA